MRKHLFHIGLVVVWAWFMFGGIYTVATGDVLWSNIHYSTGGRVVAAISVVIVAALVVSTVRMERRFKREREERKVRPPSEAIPYRCPAREGEAQCIEPEGHGGDHDFRFDYPDPA